MSAALSFVLLTKLKNQIKSLAKSPGKLIYAVILIVLLGVTLFSGGKAAEDPERVIRDIRELTAGITAMYTVLFLLVVNNGFNQGGRLFSLPDVNLIFTAPISRQRVLFYGLFQQMGTSLLVGLFILFQYSWLHNLYDISYGVLLIILVGYGITTFLGQVTAMVIYSFTSSGDKIRGRVKAGYYAVIGAFAAYVLLYAAGDASNMLPRLVEAINSLAVRLLPVAGWMGWAVSGLITGKLSGLLIGLGISALYLLLVVLLIIYTKLDYYEDVIKSAELAHSAITAQKEGAVAEVAQKNVRVGRMGIGRGFGADAIYYKHLLENRRSRTLVISTTSLIWAACIILFALFLRNEGIAPVFVFATYMQIFSVALGRLNRELTKPYIYLIPEPPFSKLLQAIREMLPSSLLEAVIIFIPVAFIIKLSPVVTGLCIIARLSFSLLFTGGNILLERIWSGASKALVILMYFVVMVLLAAPGIALAVVLSVTGSIFVSEDVTILASLIICNIPVSLLVIYLCRNMLQYAELNYK
ncbi:MAG TPA: hypothetical protein GXZ52_04915 [Clostridiales bacterium]|nr:hypothetical protein [Clostridiales bacterium]